MKRMDRGFVPQQSVGEVIQDEAWVVSQIESVAGSQGVMHTLRYEQLSGETFKFTAIDAQGNKHIIKPVGLVPECGEEAYDNSVPTFIREFTGSKVYSALGEALGYRFPEVDIVNITMKDGTKYKGLAIEHIAEFKAASSAVKRTKNQAKYAPGNCYSVGQAFYTQEVLRMAFGDTDYSPGNVNAAFDIMVDAGCFGMRKITDVESFQVAINANLRQWNGLHFNAAHPFFERAVAIVSGVLTIQAEFVQTIIGSCRDELKRHIPDVDVAREEFVFVGSGEKARRKFASLDVFFADLAYSIGVNIQTILPTLDAAIKEKAESEVSTVGSGSPLSSPLRVASASSVNALVGAQGERNAKRACTPSPDADRSNRARRAFNWSDDDDMLAGGSGELFAAVSAFPVSSSSSVLSATSAFAIGNETATVTSSASARAELFAGGDASKARGRLFR